MQRLQALLREAQADEKIVSIPSFKGLIDTHLEVKRKETITFGEFLRLLDACDEVRSNHDRKHLKLPLIGLHQLGCRKEELQKIKVKDVDLDKRIIKVWEGKRKTPEQRDAYISNMLYEAILASGVMDKGPETRVFGGAVDYKHGFRTAKKIAGIDERFRLNDLRRTGITNMVQGGMSLAAIQKQVGHKANSAMTLEIYTALSPEFIVLENQKVEDFYNREMEKYRKEKEEAFVATSEAVN